MSLYILNTDRCG